MQCGNTTLQQKLQTLVTFDKSNT